MSGNDLSPEPRAAVRVVRPGGNASGRGAAPQAPPPMPMAPPTSLPPWLGSAGSGGASGGSEAPGAAAPGDPGFGTGIRPESGTRPEDPEAELTSEQREIRDLLHRSVADLAPMPGALEHLRRAVPRRRQRRRRAVGSVVATVALCSLGTLALHSAGVSIDSAAGPQGSPYGDSSSAAPNRPGVDLTASPTQVPIGPGQLLPGVGSSFGAGAAGQGGGDSAGPESSGHPDPSLTRPPGAAPGGGFTVGGSAGTSGGASAPVAECVRGQLGDGADTVGTPDAAGVVYGTFQVTNISTTSCKVSTPGAVSVLAVSGTDKSWVSVTQHTVGDPAGGLPQPAATPYPVLLAPGGSYLVEFAWVPTTGAGAPSCAASSAPGSPSPAAQDASTGSDTGTGDTGTPAPGGGTSPSITLGHTPGAGGSTAASAVIANACAGTVYRTDPLPPAG
ncbi:hypothetical protein [Streptacidiphilus cavernicola]|uniref:DUF4232 domain-containing protein n=1 Tax=Streptacidiphilus cavernicola TaxID=3342716 RepID=A0ABV6VVZ5_9ACTN